MSTELRDAWAAKLYESIPREARTADTFAEIPESSKEVWRVIAGRRREPFTDPSPTLGGGPGVRLRK